jgi:cysteinyl-tRNA synthetase
VYDILRRYLEWSGVQVRLVSNITDIDDKIIDRANRENRDWTEITHKCEDIWFRAMGELDVLRPTDVPHATEYVEQMVAMIGDLMSRNAAYATDDGVYLDISSVPDYGLLAHQSLDDMLSGGGDREVLGAVQKRQSADFALWKFSKPGEPSWPSPWGEGRPGWHSECVVMSLELLGEGFDLHCGGADLRFPHHENERAQAVALGKTFAQHWMHNGFVVDTEGEKMSKSLGNVTNLVDLVQHYDPRAYRMLLLQTHYRSPVKVGQDNIDAAVNSLAGLDGFANRMANASLPKTEADATVIAQFRTHMDNDLDTSSAMALIFDAVRRANIAAESGDSAATAALASAVTEMTQALGLKLSAGDDIDAVIVERANALDAARKAKDFAQADAIRNELQAAGYVVETTKDGTRVRRS